MGEQNTAVKSHRNLAWRTLYQKVIPAALFFCAAIFSFPGVSYAASLYFSPSAGSRELSQSFTVRVYVSSAEQAMNAVSGVVSFPADILQVISFSKSSSIVKLWVVEPSFSNLEGTLHFEGIIMNPGFTGADGNAINITFKPKALGLAALGFSNGSVLANDGSGTNILSSLGTANFNIVKSSAPEAPVSATEKPEIFSATHPDKDTWYANSNPEFKWALPADVTAVRLSYSSDPDGKPDTLYNAIQSRNLTDIPNGSWYFHAQFKNTGGWGDVAHYRFQIDTEKPEYFNIMTETNNTGPQVRFTLEAFDKISSIDHYEIKIDDRMPISQVAVSSLSPLIYETTVAIPGKHQLSARAVDKARNFLLNNFEFTVPPISSAGSINLFALLALCVIILEALIFIFRYLWHKFSWHLKGARGHSRAKGKDVDNDHEENHTLNLFRNEMESQIMFLEETSRKRRLTKEEERILNRLRRVTGVN